MSQAHHKPAPLSALKTQPGEISIDSLCRISNFPSRFALGDH
jgi:hypothetical protein